MLKGNIKILLELRHIRKVRKMGWMNVLKYDEDAEWDAEWEMLVLGRETNKKIVEALKTEAEKLKRHISRSIFFPEIDFEFTNENVYTKGRNKRMDTTYVRFKIIPSFKVKHFRDELRFKVVTFMEKPRNTFIGHKMWVYTISSQFDDSSVGTLSEYYVEGDINQKIHGYLKDVFKSIRKEILKE